ncbi:biotin--[acetyl-CoA-carboxylase] ligase [Aquibacillus halophilus]
MSKMLGISRTAVWKHMKELQKDGYEIEGISKKGYKITQFPSKVSVNTLQWGSKTKWLGKTLIHKHSTGSTQIIGHQLAVEGTPHGTVVVADVQTEGKGRFDRKWHSSNNKGIWMSIVLRPNLLPNQAPQITLLAATVIADVIKSKTGLSPNIKWPNDVLINNKKVSGILTEMQAEQDRIQYMVLGIGININQSVETLANDIKASATSLRIESTIEWNIRDLIQETLAHFEQAYDSFIDEGFSPIKSKWESYAYMIGQSVRIKTFKKETTAQLIGIKEDGALIIKNEDGSHESLYSAEIQW